jgi:hypothetical protein
MQTGGHAVKSPPFCREGRGNPYLYPYIPIHRKIRTSTNRPHTSIHPSMQTGGHAVKSPPFCREGRGNPYLYQQRKWDECTCLTSHHTYLGIPTHTYEWIHMLHTQKLDTIALKREEIQITTTQKPSLTETRHHCPEERRFKSQQQVCKRGTHAVECHLNGRVRRQMLFLSVDQH